MDCEKNDVNRDAAYEVLDEDSRQLADAVNILNNVKKQFIKEHSREEDHSRALVASSKEVPTLDDDQIGYSRRTWRLKKKWFAKGKCWLYGLQYKWCILFGRGLWTYITKDMTKNIEIGDETIRTDALYAMKFVECDPTFEAGVVWFKELDRATAFIEVIEAHRREKLLNEYLQLHSENIYL